MLSKTKNFISWRKRKNVRRTEKAHSRATPIGASADEKSLQGTEGTYKAAHSRGAILEKVFPWVKNVEDLNDLEERLCSIARKAE